MTTPTPQSDQAATTPGRAEELAAWLEAEARYQMAYGREETAAISAKAAALLRAQSATIDRLNQLVSERTEAANDFEQKTIAQSAELLSIRHELDAANDWAKSQGLLLTQANAELLALRADKQRLDALDADFEIIVLTNCAGSERIKHNAFLNPEHKGTLRAEIDAAIALNSPTQKQPAL